MLSDQDDDRVIEIPEPDFGDETPAEALEEILRGTLTMAKEDGHMTDIEINQVLSKILEERMNDFRKDTFKVHKKS